MLFVDRSVCKVASGLRVHNELGHYIPADACFVDARLQERGVFLIFCCTSLQENADELCKLVASSGDLDAIFGDILELLQRLFPRQGQSM